MLDCFNEKRRYYFTISMLRHRYLGFHHCTKKRFLSSPDIFTPVIFWVCCRTKMADLVMSRWSQRQSSRKEHGLSYYSDFLNSRLNLLQAWCHSCSFNFPPTFACSLVAVFSFLLRFFRFFELVHAHCHMVLVHSYLKELHQERCLVADQLSNWEASSSHLYNPAKVV